MTDAHLVGSLQRRLHIAQIELRLLEHKWQELQEDIDVLEEVMTSALVALLKSEEASQQSSFDSTSEVPQIADRIVAAQRKATRAGNYQFVLTGFDRLSRIG